jgi:hypothetical protein
MNSPDDKLEPEAALRFVVDEIKECNIILEAFVADAPERCACKGLRSLAGKYRLLLNLTSSLRNFRPLDSTSFLTSLAFC